MSHNKTTGSDNFSEDSENIPSNTSANTPFNEVLASSLSRRSVVKGSLAAAATGFLAPQALAGHHKYYKKKWKKHRRKNASGSSFSLLLVITTMGRCLAITVSPVS